MEPPTRSGGPTGAGRAPAFEREALAWLDSLYRTALRLTAIAADAEDLVQETYLKAFRAADQVRARDQPEGLVVHDSPQHREEPVPRSRARHGGGRQRDRRPRRRRAAAGFGAGRASTRPKRCCCARRSTPELQAAVDALPEAFREAVWLRDVEEFSYAEIAEMLDDAGRHGDVPHLARPAPAVRAVDPARVDAGQPCRQVGELIMPDCTSIDPLVTPYVDGELPRRTHPRRRAPPTLPPVLLARRAERAVRELMRARRAALRVERRRRLRALATAYRGVVGGAAGAPAMPCAGRRAPARPLAAVRRPSRRSRWPRARPGRRRRVRLPGHATFVARSWPPNSTADHVKCFAMNERARHARYAGGGRGRDGLGFRLAACTCPKQLERAGLWNWSARGGACTARAGRASDVPPQRPAGVDFHVAARAARPKSSSRCSDTGGHLVGRRSHVRAGRARAARRRSQRMATVRPGGAAMTADAHSAGCTCRASRCASRWALAAVGAARRWPLLTLTPNPGRRRVRRRRPARSCPADAKPANLELHVEGHERQGRQAGGLQGQGHPARFLGDVVRPLQGRDSLVRRVPEEYGPPGCRWSAFRSTTRWRS